MSEQNMLVTATNLQPFKIPVSENQSILGPTRRAVWSLIERVMGLAELNNVHARSAGAAASQADSDYCDCVLADMDVRWSAAQADIKKIPTTGPLVVVANHPFGAVEGLVTYSVVKAVRPDVKVLANYLLHTVPELHDRMIFVDPFGRSEAARRNLRPLRDVLEWLQSGCTLVVFPAGTVAHWQWNAGEVVEPPWSPTIARIIRRTGAAVLPIFLEGCNSGWFQIAGLIHPRLRTALLPREFLRRKNSQVLLRIGLPIESVRIPLEWGDEETATYLRARTLVLQERSASVPSHSVGEPAKKSRSVQDVVEPVAPSELSAEIRSLTSDDVLLETSEHLICAAHAAQIPKTLREIGRLREVTFRQVGEGTGKDIDLDRFDDYYLHLFAWDKTHSKLIGAYRIGYADEILARRGPAGLYTSTLFRFEPKLLAQLGRALELGRSFVVAEYQKSYGALMLLWKGIAQCIARRPAYARLFGVVSISAEYESMTRRLLVAFLRINKLDAERAEWVQPRNPVRFEGKGERDRLASRLATSFEDVDKVVRELECDKRGVPILLRQYLKLNAKVLGFNVDPEFGGALDALMVADLPDVARPILDRFFGPVDAERFLHAHASTQRASTGPCLASPPHAVPLLRRTRVDVHNSTN